MNNTAEQTLNLMPVINFFDLYKVESIYSKASAMVENYKLELAEIESKLNDVLLQLNSPFLIQKFLGDDPRNRIDPASTSGRLMNAQVNFKKELNQHYWDQLIQGTTANYYPTLINRFESYHSVTTNQSYGVVYDDFSNEKVQAFLDTYLLKPYSTPAINDLLLLAQPHIELGKTITDKTGETRPIIVINNFNSHCSTLNRYVTAQDVIFALLFLRFGANEDWLKISRLASFAFKDSAKDIDMRDPENMFSIVHNAENRRSFDKGAKLDIGFLEYLNLS